MFKKVTENFVCEHCGREVVGNGYTNHCSKCLWSKHVDVDPGDRLETCQGLMEPISAEESGGEWSLIHQCQKCGFVRKNKISKEDNFREVIKVSRK
ncbi:MAG: RNHCP domain-containing protein [Patescibacteria group bacterium]